MSALRMGILDAGGGLFAENAPTFTARAFGVLGAVPLRSPRTRGRGEKAMFLVEDATMSARRRA